MELEKKQAKEEEENPSLYSRIREREIESQGNYEIASDANPLQKLRRRERIRRAILDSDYRRK